jgi:membrane protein implicated in regulation of membrane protease activity
MTAARKDGLGILGVGAAVCVACCAGPILAFVAGLGLAGIAGTVFVGGATLGIVAATAAAVALVVVRRRRARSTCAPDADEPVAVGPPTVKLPVR